MAAAGGARAPAARGLGSAHPAMFRHLPSLSALRVFEAAGRHLELHQRRRRAVRHDLGRQPADPRTRGRARPAALRTPAARARAHQGRRRVPRAGRRRAPPPRRGERGAARRRRRGACFASACSRASPATGSCRVCRVSSAPTPTSTSRWKRPRATPISSATPSISRSASASVPWDGLASEPLLAARVLSGLPARVASASRPPLRTPADLARHTWLEEVHIPNAWPLWLAAAGVADLEPVRRLTYDHAQLMLDAAMAGQGIALASDVIAERDLRERRLVQPFAIRAAARGPTTWSCARRTASSRTCARSATGSSARCGRGRGLHRGDAEARSTPTRADGNDGIRLFDRDEMPERSPFRPIFSHRLKRVASRTRMSHVHAARGS